MEKAELKKMIDTFVASFEGPDVNQRHFVSFDMVKDLTGHWNYLDGKLVVSVQRDNLSSDTYFEVFTIRAPPNLVDKLKTCFPEDSDDGIVNPARMLTRGEVVTILEKVQRLVP